MVPSRPDLSSEAGLKNRSDLLRLCCMICADDGGRASEVLVELHGQVDWPALIEVADHHRMAGLLHRAAVSHFTALVPAPALEALRKLCADNSVYSRRLADELPRLMDRLAAERIPVLVFKGPALGALLYRDIEARTYWDLDILIHKRDVANVTRTMLDMGYAVEKSFDWEMTFARPTRESVDVHWLIVEEMHQFPRTTEELWSRRTVVDIEGTPVPTLGAEDTLLAVCFNALTEDWQRCGRIADVARIVRSGDTIDWPALLEFCRQRGCERLVLVGLHLAKELFGVELPACVEARLRSHRRAIFKAGYAVEDFLRFVASGQRRRGFDIGRQHLRMREGVWARLPYYQSIAYDIFRPQVDDTPWQRASRQALYKVLRLPLLGLKRGLRVLGHASLK